MYKQFTIIHAFAICGTTTIIAYANSIYIVDQGCEFWHLNWVRLAPNGINLGLFKISLSTFWLGEPKCTETEF